MSMMRAKAIKNGKPVASEFQEHCLLADWLVRHKIFFHHSPNEGMHHVSYRVKQLRMGMKKGCPDFLIFDPPAPRLRGGTGLELKAKHGKATKEQIDFIVELRRCGWEAEVINTADAAIAWLESLGYGAA